MADSVHGFRRTAFWILLLGDENRALCCGDFQLGRELLFEAQLLLLRSRRVYEPHLGLPRLYPGLNIS